MVRIDDRYRELIGDRMEEADLRELEQLAWLLASTGSEASLACPREAMTPRLMRGADRARRPVRVMAGGIYTGR